MTDVYVAGHKNPDMDCTCAAVAYAALKQRLDPHHRYIPIRTGSLSPQIRDVFQQAGLKTPEHRETVAPSVEQVVRPSPWRLAPEAPILEALRIVQEHTISAIPVCTEQDDGLTTFLGVVGVNEIVSYVLAQNRNHRPVYHFRTENFSRVLPGTLICSGEQNEFSAAIMTGSMPLATTIERLSSLSHRPLLVVGNRQRIVQFAVDRQLPAIVVTGIDRVEEIDVDFTGFSGALYLSNTDTAESIRLLRLSAPVATIMDANVPRLAHSTPFDQAKSMLLASDYRGLPVFRDEQFLGMITRRSFIERPVPKLILVDHNEIRQAIEGAEQAEILEIVDHHRLAPPTTPQPISVNTRPVGSTCTLVWEEFIRTDTPIDSASAVLLLSGVISDTVNLHSPTTTDVDRAALAHLESLTGIDATDQAKRLFAQLQALQHRDPLETVGADFKVYEHRGTHFGIGQVEVTTLTDSEIYRDRLLEALNTTAGSRGLRWTMLLVTDVIKQNSLLLTNGFVDAEQRLPYHLITDRVFSLPGVLSRKKQLLPEVLRVVSEL